VRTVQGLLVARGHHVDVDGDFGGDTDKAVQAFQRARGLADDGEVGADTWTALIDER